MKWIFSFVIILLVSCNNSDSIRTTIRNDSLLFKWRQDSFGCLGFRKDSVLQLLFDKYELKKKNAEEIKKILGKPNDETIAEKYINLKYYWEAVCLDNKTTPESDKCWHTILIDTSGKEENSITGACN
jgi:hypothetical protein